MDLAIQALRRLHILEQGPEYSLNVNFQKSLKRALTGGGSHNSFGIPLDVPRTASDGVDIDVAFLDRYANDSWETILHYLVGSSASFSHRPSPSVLEMLRTSGLMSGTERTASAGNLKITSKGFQFLLEDVNTQLWGLLMRYLGLSEEKGMDTVEVMAFLFMLGSLELGRVGPLRGHETQDWQHTC